MSYIKLEDLQKFPVRRNNYDKANGDESLINGVETVLEYAKNLPTSDVVEVVRCEECEHSREIDRKKYPERYFLSHCIVCECEQVVGDEPMIYPKTHFCSYGKKSDT